MLATERLSQIEEAGADLIERIVPLDLDEQTLRVILYLRHGSNLRVTEQWDGTTLLRYSYYWLTHQNELQIGWDNVPHHKHVATYPHHKHVGGRSVPRWTPSSKSLSHWLGPNMSTASAPPGTSIQPWW
jgi:hypothetical protein